MCTHLVVAAVVAVVFSLADVSVACSTQCRAVHAWQHTARTCCCIELSGLVDWLVECLFYLRGAASTARKCREERRLNMQHASESWAPPTLHTDTVPAHKRAI